MSKLIVLIIIVLLVCINPVLSQIIPTGSGYFSLLVNQVNSCPTSNNYQFTSTGTSGNCYAYNFGVSSYKIGCSGGNFYYGQYANDITCSTLTGYSTAMSGQCANFTFPNVPPVGFTSEFATVTCSNVQNVITLPASTSQVAISNIYAINNLQCSSTISYPAHEIAVAGICNKVSNSEYLSNKLFCTSDGNYVLANYADNACQTLALYSTAQSGQCSTPQGIDGSFVNAQSLITTCLPSIPTGSGSFSLQSNAALNCASFENIDGITLGNSDICYTYAASSYKITCSNGYYYYQQFLNDNTCSSITGYASALSGQCASFYTIGAFPTGTVAVTVTCNPNPISLAIPPASGQSSSSFGLSVYASTTACVDKGVAVLTGAESLGVCLPSTGSTAIHSYEVFCTNGTFYFLDYLDSSCQDLGLYAIGESGSCASTVGYNGIMVTQQSVTVSCPNTGFSAYSTLFFGFSLIQLLFAVYFTY